MPVDLIPQLYLTRAEKIKYMQTNLIRLFYSASNNIFRELFFKSPDGVALLDWIYKELWPSFITLTATKTSNKIAY